MFTRFSVVLPGILALIFMVPFPPRLGFLDDSGSINFLNSQEITVALPVDQKQVDLEVKVINSSTESMDITLELVRVSNKEHTVFPANVVVPVSQMAKHIGAGKVHSFHISFLRTAELKGTYSGELAAIGSDGSIDHLPISLVVAPNEPVTVSDSSKGIDPNYLDELNRQALNWFPSPLAGQGVSKVSPLRIEAAQTYSGPRRLVGQVASESGPIGLVWQDSAGITVSNLIRAGKYSGKIDLNPGVTGDEIKLVVQVRDSPLYALVLLILGLLLAQWLENLALRRYPELLLDKKLTQLKQDACNLQNDFGKKLPADWPQEWKVIRICEEPTNDSSGKLVESEGMIVEEAKLIKQRYLDAATDGERKKWAADGEEVLRLEGYLKTLSAMFDLALSLNTYYQLLKKNKNIPNFDNLPVARQVYQAVQCEEVIRKTSQFEKKRSDLEGAAKFIKAYYELFVLLSKLREKSTSTEQTDRINNWVKALQMDTIISIDLLQELQKAANDLAVEIMTGADTRSLVNVSGTALPDLARDIERLQKPGPRTLREEMQLTLERMDLLETKYRWTTALIVVATGFYTLYLANPTFGSLYDYMNVLLWGTAIASGFQVARSFLPSLSH